MGDETSSGGLQVAGELAPVLSSFVQLIVSLVQQALAWKTADEARKVELRAASEAAFAKALTDIHGLDADRAAINKAQDADADAAFGPKAGA